MLTCTSAIRGTAKGGMNELKLKNGCAADQMKAISIAMRLKKKAGAVKRLPRMVKIGGEGRCKVLIISTSIQVFGVVYAFTAPHTLSYRAMLPRVVGHLAPLPSLRLVRWNP